MTPSTKPKAAPEAAPVKETVPPVKATVPVAIESVYTAEELVNSYKVFKTSREIVEIALRMAGKKTATFTEAKAIIEKFKNKEVK